MVNLKPTSYAPVIQMQMKGILIKHMYTHNMFIFYLTSTQLRGGLSFVDMMNSWNKQGLYSKTKYNLVTCQRLFKFAMYDILVSICNINVFWIFNAFSGACHINF